MARFSTDHWETAAPREKHNIQSWLENGAADNFNIMPPRMIGRFMFVE